MALPLKERMSFAVKKGTFVIMTLRKRLELQFLPKALRNVRMACSRAAGEYDVQPYRGKRHTVSRARKVGGKLARSLCHLVAVAAGGVELREISGDHLSLLKEPQVRFLAEELGDRSPMPSGKIHLR